MRARQLRWKGKVSHSEHAAAAAAAEHAAGSRKRSPTPSRREAHEPEASPLERPADDRRTGLTKYIRWSMQMLVIGVSHVRT